MDKSFCSLVKEIMPAKKHKMVLKIKFFIKYNITCSSINCSSMYYKDLKWHQYSEYQIHNQFFTSDQENVSNSAWKIKEISCEIGVRTLLQIKYAHKHCSLTLYLIASFILHICFQLFR